MLQFHIAVCDDEPFAASSISGAAERELARQGAQADIEVFNGVEPLARRRNATAHRSAKMHLVTQNLPFVRGRARLVPPRAVRTAA